MERPTAHITDNEPRPTVPAELSEAARQLAQEALADLQQMDELSHSPDGTLALMEFAGHLRDEIDEDDWPPDHDEAVATRYSDAGFPDEDAVALAGFEHFLRRRIAAGNLETPNNQ
jgi:hypothetical protein